jgi:hypothetical protein
MKLAAVYNAYDGLENLKLSIDSIRNNVDLIEIVYGKYDNHAGEMAKRQAGIDRAVANGATHVIIMDCDEVYIPGEVKDAIYYVKANNLQATACQMQTYYKYSTVKFANPETYYIPFIQSVGTLILNAWDIRVDPTRAIPANHIHLFKREDLQTHHLSHVRDSALSYTLKLVNSNANRNYKDRIGQILDEWVAFEPKTYDFSKPISIPGKGERKELLTLCEDIRKNIYG